MAAVVVVHGNGKQYVGPRSLHSGIAAALLDGARLAGDPSPAPEDVEIAFHGLWLGPSRASANKGELAPTARDVTQQLERDLLLAWRRRAARLEPDTVGPPDGGVSKAAVPVAVQRALCALSPSRFVGRAGGRFLLRVLRQVSPGLGEPEARARLQDAVAAAVTADTRVLVGHSLGSVVAFGMPTSSSTGWGALRGKAAEPGPGAWPTGPTCTTITTVIAADNGRQAHAEEHHPAVVETDTAIPDGLQDRA